MEFRKSVILLLALTTFALASQEPTGIVMLFRHGARGPTSDAVDKTWENMIGELTPVGMRQEFLRGVYLSKLYPNLFSKYDPNTIYVRSTDVNRTLMSVYSMLDGLFLGKGPSFAGNYPLDRSIPLYPLNFSDSDLNVFPFNYQPIPIHTLEGSNDELLASYSTSVCPLAANLTKNQTNTLSYTDILLKFNSTIAELSKKMNVTALTPDALSSLSDAIIADYFEGKSLPGGIDPNSDLGKNLTFLLGYTSYLSYAGTPLQRQLFSMNPLTQFKSDLEQILNGSKTNIKLYSAHDSTLIPILAALDIATHDCFYKNFFENGNYTSCYHPKFASALRFEIWKNDTDENSSEVRVYFDEVLQNVCNSTNSKCTWGAFKGLIQNITQGKGIDYYRETCASGAQVIPDNSHTGLKIAVYAAAGLAGVLLVGIIVALKRNKNTGGQGYNTF